MNLAIPLSLPKEAEEQFLQFPEQERQDVVTELVLDWLDKQARKKRREERLKNLHPITEKYAGFLKRELEKQGDYQPITDDDIAKAKDDYLTEKYGG